MMREAPTSTLTLFCIPLSISLPYLALVFSVLRTIEKRTLVLPVPQQVLKPLF